jgi:hypothetical protein
MGDQAIFESVMLFLRQRCFQLSGTFEQQVKGVLRDHLGVITGTFDIIRGENVVEESERDPRFREFIRASVASISAEMDKICQIAQS